ncbi:MAG: hypothetical protein LBV08_06990 [Clostridiales bacterium]|nr:hypothetical protein [Clostridiales bacterium]
MAGANPKIEETPTVAPTVESTQTAAPIYYDYNISFEITDIESRSFTGYQSVNFVNTSDGPIDRVYFNLPVNALNSSTLADSNILSHLYYEGIRSNGYLDIINPKIDGGPVKYNLNHTSLELILDEELLPAQKVEIAFNFEGIIPSIKYYFGANDNIIWVSNMLPQLAILNDRGWNTDISYLVGDPHFTNCSNYTVLFTIPEGYTIVCSNPVSTSSPGGGGNKKTVTYKNNNTRNFSFAVFKDSQVQQAKFNYSKDLDINFYFYSDTAKERIEDIQNAAKSALDFCNANIGRYPYTSIDFIEIDYYKQGGFSAAQNIFLDSGSMGSVSENTIASLVAKQWFSAIIGSDQIKSPWISEGLSALIADNITTENIHNSLEREYLELEKFLESIEDSSMLLDLSAYKDNYEYTKIQVTRSKLMFYALQKNMGNYRFYEFLKSMFINYSFNIIDRGSLIMLASEAYDKPLGEFFAEWQEGYTLPEFL